MKPKRKKPESPVFRLRLRMHYGEEIAIGPGKVELLKLVQETGSIAESSRRMKMSYMRAWTLIQTMNQCFKKPVITTLRGGDKNGGATLTAMGRQILELFGRLERECQTASMDTQSEIASLLRKKSGKS